MGRYAIGEDGIYLPVLVRLCTTFSNLIMEFSHKRCSLISLFNSCANIQARAINEGLLQSQERYDFPKMFMMFSILIHCLTMLEFFV